MKQIPWKQVGIFAAIIAFFLILSYAYVPDVLSGKVINQVDISGWQGMAAESTQWDDAHPEDKAKWSDSMFGGMPNIMFTGNPKGDWTEPLYKALFLGRRPGSYLFIALLGAFLMMLAFGVNKFLAVAGAIAVTFCAYNFQILQVGHNTKMQAIALAPWAIAAVAFTYNKALGKLREDEGWKDWLPWTLIGSLCFGLAISMQVKASHMQITYYLAIVILIYAIGLFVRMLQKDKRKLLGRFAAASSLLLFAGVVGIGTNASKLLPVYEYTQYTMRGGSELGDSRTAGGENSRNGLDIGYATAWSYGIEETPNLIIPNFNGGASNGGLDKDSATYKLFKKYGMGAKAQEYCNALPVYWGPQPFTAGPMYLGVISIFLFVLGLFLLPGKDKWWLIISIVLAIMMSWGNHIMWFTKLLFNCAPLYDKFRTVSMSLVILQFCVPLMGIVTLDRILKNEFDNRKTVKSIWASFGIVGGFCFLAAMVPSIAGDFSTSSDAGLQDIVLNALHEDRRHLLQVDAWRGFILVCITALALIWSYFKPDDNVRSKRLPIAYCLIGALILFDLWSVGKRYLNSSHFIAPKDFSAKLDERPVDAEILKDTTVSYRVLDLSVSTFNDSRTSFRHKSIGGYSPAKMQRYQDLIEHYIANEISLCYDALQDATSVSQIQDRMPYLPVISMLNGRYVIIGGDIMPLVNKFAFGNAWFADSLVTVSSADEELASLGNLDVRHCAIMRTADAADASFALTVNDLDKNQTPPVSNDIKMTSYSPNEVKYKYCSSKPRIAVFSEIWHPSWKASLNGQPLKLQRANWVLRSAVLPAGNGEIVMRYEPRDYVIGSGISRASSIALVLLLIGAVAGLFVRKK